ncbi:MAG: histidine phosphatase family protein [Mesorhizobium sp.]|nr:histidine phosphatase family protein [Mesorhizobium sp.]MBN9241615.1 histidine phosphatase family protein [Mesorhizobium sp.]
MLRLVLMLLLVAAPVAAQATEAGWALLRGGGHVVLLRHAAATGISEPAGFDIEKCSTQRNLSERGKQQARKIGALFAARAAPVERILSSRYCRCLDTARIAFESEPESLAALDPPASDEMARTAQMAEIVRQIGDFSGADNMVMVTHLEDIQALTGVSPREGEAVIVAPDGERLRVLGRIVF